MYNRHRFLSAPLLIAAGPLALLATVLSGCAQIPSQPVTSAPPRAVEVELQKVSFTELPGWSGTDRKAAYQAFMRSCGEIAKRKADQPAAGPYAASNSEWQAVCRDASVNTMPPDSFFTAAFVPFRLQISGANALFTGYYEPEIAISRQKNAEYHTPVYGMPSGLVSVDLGLFREKYKGERISGLVENGKLLPLPDRAAIEENGLKNAPVLAYASDPVTLFFMHIQGSGRGVLPDGTQLRLAYAGQNGYPYVAIGKVLADEGAIAREAVSAQTIRAWLKSHPDRATAVMQANPSYVFFREEKIGNPALGAKGAEGIPLTAGASIAIDPRFHPYGLPVFIATTRPDGTPWNSLFIAQDTGGAIRGAARADLYLGFGAEPEELAGQMKQPGIMYVLLPKTVAARLPARYRYSGQ